MRRKTLKIPRPPLTLADSWLDGFCADATAAFAVKRTQDALKAAGMTEAQARAIRDELQRVFEQWRKEHPQIGGPPRGGLLGDYVIESHPFDSYAAFLNELHATGYAPLTALSQRHDMALPAALMLAEAAAGRASSARLVREDMDFVLLEVERDRTKALMDVLKEVLPAAEVGWKVKGGPKKRQSQKDKRNFQAAVKPYKSAISTVADLKRYRELNFFVRQYKKETLADWLKELGMTLKAGRPRKHA